MMTRKERIRAGLTKTMRLIEIGASYNPIIPKSEGWQTTIIDHTDQVGLREKYKDHPDREAIEPVDFIWKDGSLLDLVPQRLHGTYDGLIASHVAEHIPDLVKFFDAVAHLLKPTGSLFLALPDKRLCFDFFQPLSSVGQVIDSIGAVRHAHGVQFDHAAYYARRGGEDGWHSGGPVLPFSFAHDLEDCRSILERPDTEYIDAHRWRFTPASFELLITELNLLGLIPWQIARIEPTPLIEFYVWLQRGTLAMDKDAIAARRLHLAQEIIMETQEQVAQIKVSPPPKPTSLADRTPFSICAIIPLYNGQRYIETSLHSILTQTLPPDEIIVVDDGSTDDGAAVVQRIARDHPQIRLLSKSNGGQSSARNHGIAQTECDLIALLDQDDSWYPQHLEELIKPFVEPRIGAELGWTYSDLDEVDQDGRMIWRNFLSSLERGGPVACAERHPKRSIFVCLREDMFVLPSASLISRKAFNAINGFDERLSGYEDDDLFLRLFRAGYDNVFINKALSKWRIYPESSSYSYRMRRSRAIYARKLLAEYPNDDHRARFWARHLIIPRFYRQAVAEYRDALISRDPQRIKECREELEFFVQQIPTRRNLGRLLTYVRSPTMAQLAFSARPYLRPILRRFI